MINIISSILILLGTIFIVIGTIGIFLFKGLYTRIHAASILDTIGVSLVCIGFFLDFNYNFKFIILILCMWISSPLSTYLLCRLAYTKNMNIKQGKS